jgi:hypothetical protein
MVAELKRRILCLIIVKASDLNMVQVINDYLSNVTHIGFIYQLLAILFILASIAYAFSFSKILLFTCSFLSLINLAFLIYYIKFFLIKSLEIDEGYISMRLEAVCILLGTNIICLVLFYVKTLFAFHHLHKQ